MGSRLKGDSLLKVSGLFVGLFAILLAGCTNPNPGLNFTSRNSPREAEASAVERFQNKEDLDIQTLRSVGRYGGIIQKYAHNYQVDWRLVLAVMRQESSFRPKAVSRKGAYGLMQIMPLTAAEVTQKLGVSNAKTPYNNIKTGIFHLKSLYRSFENSRGDERIKLTLAAYNAGLNRVRDAQDIARFLGEDPDTWKGVLEGLPLLSRRYQTLHKKIWSEGSPRSGYFRDVRQTQNYVDNIMLFYDEYQLALQ